MNIKLKSNYFIFLLIIILAFLLRFFNLSNSPAILTPYELAFAKLIPFSVGIFELRILSVFAGLLSVVALFVASKQFFLKVGIKNNLYPFVAMLCLAISPWHIQVSRVDFFTNLKILTVIVSIFAIYRLQKKASIIALLTLIFFTFLIVGVKHDDSLTYRLIESEKASIRRIEYSGSTLLSRTLYLKEISSARVYIENTFSYIDPRALFFEWRGNSSVLSSYSGLFYPTDLILITIGVYVFFKNYKKKEIVPLAIFFTTTLFLLSITMGSLDAISYSPTLPLYILLISIGAGELVLGKKKWIIFGASLLLLFQVARFYYYYQLSPPGMDSQEKLYVDKFIELKNEKKDIVVVDNSYGKNMKDYATFYLGKNNISFVEVLPKTLNKNILYIYPKESSQGVIDLSEHFEL